MAITNDPRVKEIKLQIGRKIAEQVDYMAKGKCASIDDYKRRAGIINGFEMSLEILDSVLKHYDPDNDDE